ncbi:uncharacterized protein LOC132193515 [Neocloeon triangulifer]|uniref:uncharacterized protein LOC132193515 n=1 Tax=Neocloeon triangulifer TaxID=2078957 RepID=UPI00286EDF2A|nr:uncharacterized protein LOC132193515 [Neocloeon triangulifer]XP_059470217.1 uncharacterized protein LOC132193515 [Neocloeon triangulifer]
MKSNNFHSVSSTLLLLISLTNLVLRPTSCAALIASSKDLAADVETAHTDLLLLSARSSACFFRTNDIFALVNNDYKINVQQITLKFEELNVTSSIIDQFRSDMQQTDYYVNTFLRLQKDAFESYEARVHTYENNLLTNLPLIPENLAHLREDTNSTNSIFEIVDNNLTKEIYFLNSEVQSILSGYEGEPAEVEAQILLQEIISKDIETRFRLNVAKSDFDVAASNADGSMQIVASQV